MIKPPLYDEADRFVSEHYDETTQYVRRTPKRTRNRKPTLAGVMRQAAKAGIDVARFEIDPTTGKITIVTGAPVVGSDSKPDWTKIDASDWN